MIGIRAGRLEGTVTLNERFGGVEDQWLMTYDPEAYDGRGEANFTADPDLAMEFYSITEAMTFYRQVSKVRPVREDGKPNRPLTAFTVSFETLP